MSTTSERLAEAERFAQAVVEKSAELLEKLEQVEKDRDALRQQVQTLREALSALVFTASELWDDVKPIKDSDVMRVTHPIIEQARDALAATEKK